MQKKKRFLSFLLAVVMALGVLPLHALAAEDDLPCFAVSDAVGKPGDTVTVTVSARNNPGIITARLKLGYDAEKLDLIGVSDSGLLAGYMGDPDETAFDADPWVLYWDDALSAENNAGNGTLATLTFRVLETFTSGTTAITLDYDANEVFDKDLNNVSFRCEDGAIAAEQSRYGTPTYVWADDHSKCTASAECADGDPVIEEVTVTSAVTTPAGCEDPGTRTFTAAFTKEPFTTQTKTEEIPATGHNYLVGGTSGSQITYVCETCGDSYTGGEAGAAAFVVSNGAAQPGEDVQVTVSLRNNPGIITAVLKLSYDRTRLQLTGVADGGLLQNPVLNGDYAADPYVLYWDSATADGNITADGTLATLTFRVAEDAPEGDAAITLRYDPENVYDYDFENKSFAVENGKVTVTRPAGGGGDEEEDKDDGKIRVTFRLTGDTVHGDPSSHEGSSTWISTTRYTLNKGATVYDLFVTALSDAGLSSKGAGSNYVTAIKSPEGYWLSQRDNGPNSGWMFSVNGVTPSKAMKGCVLEDGDSVVWYYEDDYTNSGGSGDSSGSDGVTEQLEQIVSAFGEGEVRPKLKRSHLGKDVTFTFRAKKGYVLQKVYVDGVNVGAVERYTYENLKTDSRIEAFFVPEITDFTDVETDFWAYDHIQYVVRQGLFEGVGGGRFAPLDTMTRGMIVTVLHRLAKEPAAAGTCTFTDVQPGLWYSDAVLWAESAGIINGYGNGLFGVADYVTREQLTTILYRFALWSGMDVSRGETVDLSGYVDGSEISEYAVKAMQWACGEGILSGRPSKVLAPQDTALRSEVAAMMHRFVENTAAGGN